MHYSEARRGPSVISLVALLALGAGALVPVARADPVESLVCPLRAELRKQPFRKLLLVVREEQSGATGDAAPREVDSLRRQIADCARDLSLATTEVDRAKDVPEVMLATSPDPADWRGLLQAGNAEAAIVVTWKSAKSALAIRVVLLNDQKLVWTGRGRLRRDGAAKVATKPGRSNKGGGLSGSQPVGGGGQGGGRSSGSAGASFVPASDANAPASNSNAGTPANGGSAPDDDPAVTDATGLNEQVLSFAKNHLWQQVANGQCYELATEALAYARAQPARGNDFGQDVALTELQPGDVLQFYNARIVSPTLGTWQLGSPGHTAIVGRVKGMEVTVYHQNINSVPRVRSDVLDLSGLVSGQILGYRAQPRSR